ncbi:MAG TPA: pectinesterase family protein [Candidatus Sulfotelmatobacter sp.]|nr:pectinesterase family protein [Candidatus Sulfotelmatobacter sp.]
MNFKTSAVLLSLAITVTLTLPSAAQTAVLFYDTFQSGDLSTLNPANAAQATPTSTTTAYEIASSKNATTTTIAAGALTLSTASTSSGYTEAQALFTTAPVTLNTPGQYIEIEVTFTDTTNVFNGFANNNEQLNLGLFNSGGGSAPTNGTALWNSGLSSSLSSNTNGACKGWVGYSGAFAYSSNATLQASAIASRPAQSGVNNLNQGIGYNSGYAGSANLVTLNGVTAQPRLATGSQYTSDLKIYYISSTTLGITNTLYNGAGNTGAVFSAGGWTGQFGAQTASPLTMTFDGLDVGIRPTGSVATTLPINGITVSLVTPVAPSISGLTNETVVAGTSPVLAPAITAVPPAAFQWQTNGVDISGATNATLALSDVQYAQNGYTYTLIATNALGAATNSMVLTVIVTPSISGLNNQAALVGDTVMISPNVSGVPAPTLQWQVNGVNLTDGPDANGSIIAGSTTATLDITNAQVADNGVYSLIASNSAGIVTNSMTLTVASGNQPPVITGPTNTTVVQGNNATFVASVTGVPVPTLQWLDETQTPIPDATNATLTLTDVQYSQNGYSYYIVASNSAGIVTNSAVLTVIVPPMISMQPANLVVTNTQSASFSVVASGVPAVVYQWSQNGTPISTALNNTATNATFTIASASSADTGSYSCSISNAAGVTNTVSVTLTVNSTMSVAALTPNNGGTNICYDTPLYITFSSQPTVLAAGTIKIYNITNSATPVDTIDLSQNVTNNPTYAANVQPYSIGGQIFTNFPVIISGRTAAIYPHHGLLTSNQTYCVTVDDGTFADSAGAWFAGITATNEWTFTTKPTGPANPTNLVVAQDYSGDFATVQGAVDSVPANNTTPTLITIHNGTYTEVVNVQSKNNITLRGQSRSDTTIVYANNSYVYGNTHNRMTFRVAANDIALDNLTVSNSTPQDASQAEALMLESGAARIIVNNCNVDSTQDTILANISTSKGYFNSSLVQGDVDFIWGGGNLFFTNCQILYLTRQNSSASYGPNPSPNPATDISSNGFSFVNCALQTLANGSPLDVVGRTRSITNGNTALINCFVSTNIGGWSSDAIPTNDFRNWYYNCTNDYGTVVTLSNGIPLSAGDPNVALAGSATAWLYGWQPELSPNILTNPASQAIGYGSNAVFIVAATGIPAPTYQWLFNGTNLPAATNASLTIAGVTFNDAGSYAVVVSTLAGNVTSAAAVLTVIPLTAPVQSSAAYSNGQFSVSVSGQVGLDYELQATTNLATGTWTDVLATNSPQAMPFVLVDTNASGSAKFYRIVAGPPSP